MALESQAQSYEGSCNIVGKYMALMLGAEILIGQCRSAIFEERSVRHIFGKMVFIFHILGYQSDSRSDQC